MVMVYSLFLVSLSLVSLSVFLYLSLSVSVSVSVSQMTLLPLVEPGMSCSSFPGVVPPSTLQVRAATSSFIIIIFFFSFPYRGLSHDHDFPC